MPPTSKKLRRHIALGLSVPDSVHASITLFDAYHSLGNVHALKFHV